MGTLDANCKKARIPTKPYETMNTNTRVLQLYSGGIDMSGDREVMEDGGYYGPNHWALDTSAHNILSISPAANLHVKYRTETVQDPPPYDC